MDDRTYYTFDKRQRYVPGLKIRIFVCASSDCGNVVHHWAKKGQQPKWCSARCYVRERQRRIRCIPRSKHWPRKPRHKGVLGTQHLWLR